MNNQSEEEKKEIPNPPSSKVSVRTMQSDINSIKESGGQNPQPYTSELNQKPKKETPTTEETSFQPTESESSITGYAGPEEPIFQPGAFTSPLPPKQKPNQAGTEAKPRKKTSKVLIISIILILAAATEAGYYFFVKNQKTNPSLIPLTAPLSTETPAPTPAPQYVSLLRTPNALQEEIIIPSLTLGNIKNALLAAINATPINNLKEVILRKPDQSLVAFSEFFPTFIPELTGETISAIFKKNFTIVIFVDENGVWPGYIAQLNPNFSLIAAQAAIKQSLESSVNLTNIFLKNAGSAIVFFKDGKAGNPTINTRYLVFPEIGATMNYGWVNDKIVISASSSGLLEILKKLQ